MLNQLCWFAITYIKSKDQLTKLNEQLHTALSNFDISFTCSSVQMASDLKARTNAKKNMKTLNKENQMFEMKNMLLFLLLILLLSTTTILIIIRNK